MNELQETLRGLGIDPTMQQASEDGSVSDGDEDTSLETKPQPKRAVPKLTKSSSANTGVANTGVLFEVDSKSITEGFIEQSQKDWREQMVHSAITNARSDVSGRPFNPFIVIDPYNLQEIGLPSQFYYVVVPKPFVGDRYGELRISLLISKGYNFLPAESLDDPSVNLPNAQVDATGKVLLTDSYVMYKSLEAYNKERERNIRHSNQAHERNLEAIEGMNTKNLKGKFVGGVNRDSARQTIKEFIDSNQD
jgi:hypothetical protein